MASSRLAMRGIRKRFGPTPALLGVELELRAAEVHALVGENGAGKSTLMKVLSGAVAPDRGTMELDGRLFLPRSPQQARRRGVSMVYQELTLAPHLNVEANILLGLEETRWGFLRRRAQRTRVEEALAVLQHPEIRCDSPVSRLSAAARQLVEIARALLVDARVLILDEPTSSLTQEDARRLFGLIRRLRDRGTTVVYISHFLEEVQEIADRFTVLRDGRNVCTGEVAAFAREAIIEHMVGRAMAEQFPRLPHTMGAPVLEIKELCGAELPCDANLTLHRGEILGMAGIVGAGRSELLRAVYGLDPVRRGQVVVRTNRPVSAGKAASPRERIEQGVGMLSEDRKLEGLALSRTVADNLTYSRLALYSRFGWLNLRRRAQAVDGWLSRLNIRPGGAERSVAELSGGNQQKVALGRLLHQEADVLLLDEPTRGIDIASKAEVYRLIGELAQQGKGIIFVSSYLPELLGICDRIAVMSRGRLSAVRDVAHWTPEEVMAFATAGIPK